MFMVEILCGVLADAKYGPNIRRFDPRLRSRAKKPALTLWISSLQLANQQRRGQLGPVLHGDQPGLLCWQLRGPIARSDQLLQRSGADGPGQASPRPRRPGEDQHEEERCPKRNRLSCEPDQVCCKFRTKHLYFWDQAITQLFNFAGGLGKEAEHRSAKVNSFVTRPLSQKLDF